MRHLLDTNVLIEAVGGTECAVAALRAAVESVWVGYSAITRLELFSYPNLTRQEELALAAILDELEKVPVTREVVDGAIALRKAHRMKVPDAIIAATALVMKSRLVTRNEYDFRSVADLEVMNPWAK